MSTPVPELPAQGSTTWMTWATGIDSKARLVDGKADSTDARLTNQRVPTDGSVTNAKVATGAGISLDKTTDSATRLALTPAERTQLAGVQAQLDATVKQVRINGTTTSPVGGLVDLGTITGTGGSGSASRQSAVLTTSSLAANASVATTVAMATSYRVLSVATNRPARVRVYATAAGRDADLGRALGAAPAAGSGLWLEFVTAVGQLAFPLATLVDGASLEATPSANTPITVTNLDGTAGAVTVTLNYLRAETLEAGGGPVTSTSITDSTTVGRSVLTATDAAAARTAIGVPAATSAVSGIVRLSPSADALTGTSTTIAVTPSALKAVTDSVERIPAGSTLTARKPSGGAWPARPTARTDVTVLWVGAEPSPAVVASGTGGMLDNVDLRFVTA